MSIIIGILVILASMIVGLYIDGGLTQAAVFFNGPFLIFILIPAVVFLVSAASWERAKLSLKLVFSNSTDVDKDEAESACILLNSFGVISLLFAILGMLIGLVLMLANLDNPERLGINLSIVAIGVYYGVLLRLLCFFATKRIRKRLLIEN